MIAPDNDPMVGISLALAISAVIWAVLWLTFSAYENLPTVALDVDGMCVYIQQGVERTECHALPDKYHTIRVASR